MGMKIFQITGWIESGEAEMSKRKVYWIGVWKTVGVRWNVNNNANYERVFVFSSQSSVFHYDWIDNDFNAYS